jgi:hypothetical protein
MPRKSSTIRYVYCLLVGALVAVVADLPLFRGKQHGAVSGVAYVTNELKLDGDGGGLAVHLVGPASSAVDLVDSMPQSFVFRDIDASVDVDCILARGRYHRGPPYL